MIIFDTPGKLDVRAITTFGINSKPHSATPIGFFGTGLKYAIAVLMREGCKVQLVTNGDTYDFAVMGEEFREKNFDFIHMQKQKQSLLGNLMRVKGEALPFTTELGKKWKLWQAFRELYSNTLDEAGQTYLADELVVLPGRSYIIVEGEAFEGEFDKRFDGTFLQEGLVVERKQGVQILPRESNVVYYRGVRIMDLQKPSLFTYNVLSAIDLTEDRTAKYTFQIEEEVRNELVGLDDRSMLEAVLNADETAWEHCLDFEGMRQTMSPEFILVGSESRNCTARKLIRNHDENWIAAQKAKHFTERLAEHITEGEWNKFRDLAEENQEELFQILVGLRPASWEPRAEMIIKSPTLYIVIGDNSTYGAFCNKEAANKRIEELHENGYFGELLVSEEEGCE